MTYTDSTTPTYCSVEDIEETLDLPDPSDPTATYRFSDMSHPSAARVTKFILAAEDEIDRRTRRTWRVNYVKDYMCSIQDYWHDINGIRMDYFQNGGNYVQLRKNILPWDPDKGDKLEMRTHMNCWRDITGKEDDNGESSSDERYNVNRWFDYPMGKLYLRNRLYQLKPNAIRISYRYGSQEPVPAGINRLCSLIVASKVLTMSMYDVKLGMGGDVAGVKDQLLRAWAQEIGELYTSFQRSGSVHSLLR